MIEAVAGRMRADTLGFYLRRTYRGRTVCMGFLDKAKDLLAQNADKVDTAIEKAGEFADEKTKGKYTDAIHKVQDEAKKAADRGDKK
jgi:hypothetical protein